MHLKNEFNVVLDMEIEILQALTWIRKIWYPPDYVSTITPPK